LIDHYFVSGKLDGEGVEAEGGKKISFPSPSLFPF